MNRLPSPWCTRAEASEYLRYSVDSIDRVLVPIAEGKKRGAIRFQRMISDRKIAPVRLVSSDVLDLLPPPDGTEGTESPE